MQQIWIIQILQSRKHLFLFFSFYTFIVGKISLNLYIFNIKIIYKVENKKNVPKN